ncbi:MAG: hypothetical protein WHS44_12335 [Fimbriimonadales bacterium]|nr:MAG: hypothetical protein KatS3mg018_2118 [Fimbriimonadales bacterium]
MADILKPVDAEELKQIEQEPYEQRDLSVGRAVQFLVIIFFTIIGSLIISYFVYQWVLPNQRADMPSVRSEALQRQLPPEPRVQGFPMRDWEKFAAEETRKTTTYELVDETTGKARIPVERAKELILQRGL